MNKKEEEEKMETVEEVGNKKKKIVLDKEGFKCEVGISNSYHDETAYADDSVTLADVRSIFIKHVS